MTRRPFALIVLCLVALLVPAALTACGGGDDDDSTPTTKDRDHDGIRDSRDKCPKDKEDKGLWGSDPKDGCPGTIDDLVELARGDIDSYWASVFEEEDTEYDPPIKFEAYTEEIDTGCGPASLDNAFYCSADHSIYYDRNFLANELADNGDFEPVLIIAHEWGHLVQSLVGILSDETYYSIQIELQADCLAGVWAADADSRGVMEKGDFEEGIIGLFRVGDPEDAPFDPDAHGTSGQRIDSFTNGFKHGLEACSID